MKLVLIFFLSSLSIAILAKEISFIKDEQGKCLLSFQGKKKVKFKGTVFYKDSLEYHFCERMNPKNYKDAFSIGRDYPANLLGFKKNTINRYQDKNLSIETNISLSTTLGEEDWFDKFGPLKINKEDFKKLSTQADWESLYDINSKAIELWTGLTDKYGAEIARNNYYKIKSLEKEDINDIAAFRRDVKMYLQSSEIGNTWGLSQVGRIHPLLNQVILELLSTKFPTFFDKDFLDFHYGEYSQAINIVQRESGIDWTRSIAQDSELQKYIKKVRKEEQRNIDFSGIDDLSRLEQEQINNIRTYLNAIYLLQMSSDQHCSDWGLWPGITRVITDYTISMVTLFSPEGLYQISLENISGKLAKSCGRNKKGAYNPLYRANHGVSPIYRTKHPQSKKLFNEFIKLAKKWERID